MKTPVNILYKLIDDWFFKGKEYNSTWKLGVAVESLNINDREILKNLTSTDIENLRLDVWTPIKQRKK